MAALYPFRDWGQVKATPADLTPYVEGAVAATLDPPGIFLFVGGVWTPLASVEGNVPAPTVVQATEDQAGIAEVATEGETNQGLLDTVMITPQKLAGRTATEDRAGLAELATEAEIQAGTTGNLVATAARLKAELDRRATPESPHLVGGAGEPAFQNGWINHGGGLGAVAFWKDSSGCVHLEGTMKNGSRDAAAFTLPAGYRPGATMVYDVGVADGSAENGRLEVTAAGAVVQTGGTASECSLNGVYFRAVQ